MFASSQSVTAARVPPALSPASLRGTLAPAISPARAVTHSGAAWASSAAVG